MAKPYIYPPITPTATHPYDRIHDWCKANDRPYSLELTCDGKVELRIGNWLNYKDGGRRLPELTYGHGVIKLVAPSVDRIVAALEIMLDLPKLPFESIVKKR